MTDFTLPDSAEHYRTTALFTENDMPAGFRANHRTKAGVWAVVCVERGKLPFYWEDGAALTCIAAGERLIVPPETPHRVEPTRPVAFRIEFWRDRQPT